MKEIFALIDCNNFFVSCERVFNPKLKNKPTIVLSNNDGCAISRSNEVKALGIPMGAPIFKYKEMVQKHDIQVFSTNFVLYGDMSNRVMKTLSQFTPDIEIYSIDEAFLSLQGVKRDLTEYGKEIRDTVYQWTGIPVSVGIAHTKTLAKAANKLAKTTPKFNGVLDLTSRSKKDIDSLLKKVEVGDVWGVGRKHSKRLRARGIDNAYKLKGLNDKWVKEKMTIMGLRMVKELRGESCIDLEQAPQPRKSIVFSRSFGEPIESLRDLSEAVSNFTTKAAEKLRKQNLNTKFVMTFVATNRFKKDEPQYFNGINFKLPVATNNTPDLIKYSLQSLRKIFRSGYKYKKAGVMMMGLIPSDKVQINMFEKASNKREENLMKVLDKINGKWGGDTVKYASSGVDKVWKMRQLKKSQLYTTRWSGLLKIGI